MKKGLIFTAAFRIAGSVALFQGVRMIVEGVCNFVADKTSAGLKDLVIFLVFGGIFSLIGFFMSGAWALIRKIRRRGLPEEEEYLPPEEYVTEEAPQESLSPAKQLVIRLICVAIWLGFIFLLIKYA